MVGHPYWASKFIIAFSFLPDYQHALMLRLEESVTKGEKMLVRADPNVKTLASAGEQLSRGEIAARHRNRRIRRKEHIVPLEEIEEEGSRRELKQ